MKCEEKGDENPGIQMESDMSNVDESALENRSESSGSVNSVLQNRSDRSAYTLRKTAHSYKQPKE